MPVDPSALATWANAITVGRLLLSPVMFWVIPDHDRGSWIAFGLWFVLCASDAVDGYIARRHGATRSGAFLDPLADKVLVLGAMFTLVGEDVFWILPGGDHRRAGVRDQHVPHRPRLPGGERAGQPDGQAQDARPAARRRVRPAAAHRGRRLVAVERVPVARRRARRRQRGAVPVAGSRRPDPETVHAL